jgi:hypothetical protein
VWIGLGLMLSLPWDKIFFFASFFMKKIKDTRKGTKKLFFPLECIQIATVCVAFPSDDADEFSLL